MDIQKEVIRLEQVLLIIGAVASIHYIVNDSQEVKSRWVGYLDLSKFIDHLFILEHEDLKVYTELTNNHKKVIDKAKNLVIELRLQNLPIPFIEIYHNSSKGYGTGTLKYLITVGDDSIWGYFCNHCPDSSDTIEVEKQVNEYLSKVGFISGDVCEAITSTIRSCLEDTSKNVTI